MNVVVLSGRLGKDPVMRYTPGGHAVADVKMAVKNPKKDANDQWYDDAIWVKLTFWRLDAERAAEKFRKGDMLHIVGKLEQPRTYQDRDGVTRVEMSVTVSQSELLIKGSGHDQVEQTYVPDDGSAEAEAESDDLELPVPF